MARQTVPILTCFDDNYVIPAAVAFRTLVENADPAHHYLIYVAHSDITPEHQARLTEEVAAHGTSASLVFMDMQHRLADLFERTGTKGHYSKEMFYKLLAPSLFPQHDKMLVTDVDVVFTGDVSRDFLAFDGQGDAYLAGSPSLVKRGSWVHQVADLYVEHFTQEERSRLKVGAGYYVVNLARMRADGLEARLVQYAQDHAHRLRQPEQDVLNLVCHPHIALLPADSMVCTYAYDYYRTDTDLHLDLHYSAGEVRQAMANPVQLHYAGRDKPWNSPACTRSEVWFAALGRTGFLRDHLVQLGGALDAQRRQKVVASMKLPFSRRQLVLSKTKI